MTKEELTAKPIGAQVYIRFNTHRFVWRFTKTTPHNWKRTNPELRTAWASNGHLAYLIREGTQTNSLGEEI